jgi:hypothetical protein
MITNLLAIAEVTRSGLPVRLICLGFIITFQVLVFAVFRVMHGRSDWTRSDRRLFVIVDAIFCGIMGGLALAERTDVLRVDVEREIIALERHALWGTVHRVFERPCSQVHTVALFSRKHGLRNVTGFNVRLTFYTGERFEFASRSMRHSEAIRARDEILKQLTTAAHER